jgi:spermidine synthase
MMPFAVTIFLGAFLLFQVQPLMGKFILPWFGGAPGVWTTCLLFFQTGLLGGYAYAHFICRRLQPKQQALVHLLLVAAAVVTLPISPALRWKPQPDSQPVVQILALLAANVGLPYLVLSSTGPMLQAWTGWLQPGAVPYRLYALSNTGSLLALVSFPFVFEPRFSRATLSQLWSWLFVAYAGGSALCAVKLWRRNPAKVSTVELSTTTASSVESPPFAREQPSNLRRLLWLMLPACASILLLAITNKLCQDIAVVPFLWIAPLSLYLLSFVICFDHSRWYGRLPFALALVVALVGICYTFASGANWLVWKQAAVYCGGLFVCAMVCHGELYRLRPLSTHLTEFYLWIAAGGALGGLLVAVLAPLCFSSYYELHWGLWLCAALFVLVCLVEGTRLLPKGRDIRPAPPSWIVSSRLGRFRHWGALARCLLVLGLGAFSVILATTAAKPNPDIVHQSRNFYGVLKVFEHSKDDPLSHRLLLQHGRITHGIQFLDPQQTTWPTTYYGTQSGVGLALDVLPGWGRRVGVVGLGAGTVAAHGKPGDVFRFYEINPEVIRLASSPFSFLSNSLAKIELVRGDARLSLEDEPSQQFDLLILDAFTSDAIPVHLLTREAFTLYERHLRTNGMIAVHISNHFLDLEPVVERLARQFNYESAVIDYEEIDEQWWLYSSTWVLLTHDERFINLPEISTAANPSRALPKTAPLWTDDFTSLFQILK